MYISKKILALFLVVALAIIVVACNVENGKDDGKYVIGISQLMIHDALDAETRGFKDALAEELGEDNVKFDTRYAGGSSELCDVIANTFVNNGVDLILANAAPSLKAASEATTEIPILGTSVAGNGGGDSEGEVGRNVSGTSDSVSLEDQAQMILDLVPNAQAVGIIYRSAEQKTAEVKAYLEGKGVSVVLYPFADAETLFSATQTAASECDALYIPDDDLGSRETEAIYHAMADHLKPLIAGNEAICKACGIATLTVSYYDLGYATGLMAAKILKGEEKIENMQIEYSAGFVKKYNAEMCEELGIDTETLETAGYVAIQ